MMQILLSLFHNSFRGLSWMRLIDGGAAGSFVFTAVNVTKRIDTGKINSSPVTSTPLVMRVQQNCEHAISITGKSSLFCSALLIDPGD